MEVFKTEVPIYVFSEEEKRAIWLLHLAEQKICDSHISCSTCPFNGTTFISCKFDAG